MAASIPGKRQSSNHPITRFNSVVVRFRRLATTGLIAAMVVHMLLLGLFWLLDVGLLMAFNLFSVLLYGLCLVAMQYPNLRPAALVLAWLEIIVHAGIATMALGPESGFHYFLLVQQHGS